MTQANSNSIAFALITVLFVMWCSHQFSQVPFVFSPQADAYSSVLDHDHSEEITHQSGLHHHHLSGTADHLHDSVQLPEELRDNFHPVSTLSQVFRADIPLSPFYRFERPPRSFS